MRVIGLDVGERRIGVAISDPDERLAVPLQVLERRGPRRDVAAVAELAERESAGRIVLGLPLSLSGEEGPQAREVRRFGQALAAALPVPVEYWDERLSTVEADRLLAAAGERGRRRRGWRDAVAASIVLQAYLDAHRGRVQDGEQR
ncbi:MAG TPA: Holliday junction resolvase RuvX [Dehalococcoidia bacterium]